MKKFAPFIAFVKERYAIFLKRKKGLPAPWTSDPILQKYRFTNVYREDDRVTIWIKNNLRDPLADSPLLITAMSAARLINRIETLEVLKPLILKHGWHNDCEAMMRSVAESGEPITGAAYMITTPQGMDKAAGISHIVHMIHEAGVPETATLRDLAIHLMKFPRVGGFISAQVVADCKYTPQYANYPDWWTFALSGPGSRRGLNYVCGHPWEKPWDENEWHTQLMSLKVYVDPIISSEGMPRMCAQNLQNALCEMNKYSRAQAGVAEPKQLYRPIENSAQESFI